MFCSSTNQKAKKHRTCVCERAGEVEIRGRKLGVFSYLCPSWAQQRAVLFVTYQGCQSLLEEVWWLPLLDIKVGSVWRTICCTQLLCKHGNEKEKVGVMCGKLHSREEQQQVVVFSVLVL